MSLGPGTPTTIDSLAAESVALGRPEFLAKYPHPWLVATNWRQTAWGGDAESTAVAPADAGPGAGRIAPDAPVWAVTKRDVNDLAAIAVGRSPRADVVVPEPGISKLHAYLTQDGADWTLTDGESRNGTRLDGATLEPLRAVPLGSGQQVQLGPSARFRFLDAGAMWEALGAVRAA